MPAHSAYISSPPLLRQLRPACAPGGPEPFLGETAGTVSCGNRIALACLRRRYESTRDLCGWIQVKGLVVVAVAERMDVWRRWVLPCPARRADPRVCVGLVPTGIALCGARLYPAVLTRICRFRVEFVPTVSACAVLNRAGLHLPVLGCICPTLVRCRSGGPLHRSGGGLWLLVMIPWQPGSARVGPWQPGSARVCSCRFVLWAAGVAGRVVPLERLMDSLPSR